MAHHARAHRGAGNVPGRRAAPAERDRQASRGEYEEDNVRRTSSPRLRVAALAAMAAIAFSACSGRGGATTEPAASTGSAPSGAASSGAAPSTAAGGGTMNLAINPWVGYEADAAVVGYLAKSKLGATVNEKNLKEEISWQGFESGDVDVILENWGHADLAKTYIDDKKVALDAGPTGNKGIIGWYVPPWLATAHPDILDWNNLNKYADQFKTTESGNKGQLLDGDPSYVTNDEALVSNLKLNYKVVYAGSENALIEAFRQAEQQKKWVIGYFYEPQWFLAEVPLVRVKLPAYTAGCDADPKKVACDYPDYILNKVVSKKFCRHWRGPLDVREELQLDNEDQNSVAASINGGMSHDDAAKQWIDAHPDVAGVDPRVARSMRMSGIAAERPGARRRALRRAVIRRRSGRVAPIRALAVVGLAFAVASCGPNRRHIRRGALRRRARALPSDAGAPSALPSGTLAGLVAAARQEGALTTIGLSPGSVQLRRGHRDLRVEVPDQGRAACPGCDRGRSGRSHPERQGPSRGTGA